MPQPRRLIQGNEAVAEGAIAAGARFFAGYPITPSTEIAETLSRRMPEVGGSFLQMEDEIASMGAVIGSSLAGVKALTATSGPGFSLMQELIGYAAMAQVPCVIVDVMRGGPSTGLPTDPSQGDVMQARWGTHGEHSVIVVAPSSVRECFTLTVDAFNFSEQYRTPVIMLSDAVIGHMREAVALPLPEELRIAERGEPDCDPEDYDTVVSTIDHILPRPALGSRFRVHVTGLVYDRRSGAVDTSHPEVAADLGMYLREKIYHHRDAIVRVEEVGMEDAEIGLFAYGSVARSARAAMKAARRKGIAVGLLRPITLWPFPTAAVDRMAEQVRTVIVPEMNIRQMAWEVQAAVAGRAEVVDLGRVDGRLITPAQIDELIERKADRVRAR
ncbi:MAG TPA: 2-oxoacid:acceptor oxidoreductase subunit alpha [Thermoleophilia bacterium]|nr:2-oxoacid:acceptor oxidoreductase subunit alpha [Thermoleophilia bacterium]HQG04109.1 2-oxoacid:acceptor oxidoreductase subunit alpha [Thermoleophilia bacterium]HQG55253.1 2-oxoacid:acceptor oxidoreductase subunit alpha [Thermoleophilia bacterium]HQJ98321.1 2-oxoacid:acceptor oxidoreductase subunit alpha [Thermoleophilia bacterium]